MYIGTCIPWMAIEINLCASVCFDWNCFKNFKGASVCFDQSKLIFDQSKIMNKVFKNLILTYSTHVFQNFFKLFFLSPTRQRLFIKFLSFSSQILQGFPLSKLVCSFYPFFCIYFHVFMHKFLHFVGIFGPIQIWSFWWFKPSFLKLIIGFCCYNVVNMIYDV